MFMLQKKKQKKNTMEYQMGSADPKFKHNIT